MADTDVQDDPAKVASHTLAYLRLLDKKVDLVLDTQNRHTERLGRLERDLGESRRDMAEIKSDIALLENKILSAQTEILMILHRLEQAAAPSVEHADAAPAGPGPG